MIHYCMIIIIKDFSLNLLISFDIKLLFLLLLLLLFNIIIII